MNILLQMLMLKNQLLFTYLLTNNKINCGGWEDIVNDLLSIFQNPEMVLMLFCTVASIAMVLIIVTRTNIHKNKH